MLREGGNAFDAALAALFAACVAEPVLASLGGAGFLLARPADADPVLFDFFAQTPVRKRAPAEVDFQPIIANFGTAQQEFHIGMGSIATPGTARGAFDVHAALSRMPMTAIVEPAIAAARRGVEVNAFQHYIASVVEPILRSSPQALELHASRSVAGELAGENERVDRPELAGMLDALAREGPDLLYRGAIARRLVKDSREGGGHLTMEDLTRYRTHRRTPLARGYRGARVYTNPAPSVGGTLIAFAMGLLEPAALGALTAGGEGHLRLTARAMRLIQQLRRAEGIDRDLDAVAARRLLGEDQLAAYRDAMETGLLSSRGTTQISIADIHGNLASMTLSNGEGCGYVLPGTGIMLNNMLGEEDINPHGFHAWPTDRRLASMMAPTIVISEQGRALALGSGGSNRIRSAILQVLINFLDMGMSVEQAVEAPRIHFENDMLNLEPGLWPDVAAALGDEYPRQCRWPEKNIFFGGAHSVVREPDGRLSGCGDSRRGGVCLFV
ncbi:MAG: gamma-glutamyltransferase [Chromatiales bacterium]